MKTCLSCGYKFEGKFCSNCGQKAEVKRLTYPVLMSEILHFFTHLEKGFLRTSVNLVTRPGVISIEYLKGRRKTYQQPFSYFIIWTGLYILVHNSIINHFHYHLASEQLESMDISEQANVFLRTHFTAFIIPLILLSALIIYPLLGPPAFNLVEVVTLCFYGGGTYFMMLLFSDVVLGIFFHVNTLSAEVFLWQTVLSSVYNFWFSYHIFKGMRLRFFWLRLVIVAVLLASIGLLMLLYLPVAWLVIQKAL